MLNDGQIQAIKGLNSIKVCQVDGEFYNFDEVEELFKRRCMTVDEVISVQNQVSEIKHCDFDRHINNTEPDVTILGHDFTPSEVLERMDNSAYIDEFNDWREELEEDDQAVMIDDEYYMMDKVSRLLGRTLPVPPTHHDLIGITFQVLCTS